MNGDVNAGEQTTVEGLRDPIVVAERPLPGVPRPYDFPTVREGSLANGLRLQVADLPGRPLISATVILPVGAADEPADVAGSAVLAARAMTEGTERHDAIALTEAAERLGASIHAEAGWDATSVGVEVPASRLESALELLADVLLTPTFPEAEIDRLRDERLNDLLQAAADPRRRADETYIGTIYSPASPYHRPAAGTRETVERLDRDVVQAAYARILDPRRGALIVAGDLGGQDVETMAARLFGPWTAGATAASRRDVNDTASGTRRLIRVVHRPESVQTEIRIGHRGLPRRIDDFHAVAVMSAILGGLFNSRLNMQLREAKGYTYGAGAGFDMRRGAGPFTARAAVNTEVTVPAVLDTLAELERMRDTPVTPGELEAARDFLVGVFPLRFETPGAVVGALGGLAVHGLELAELIDYRRRIEEVDLRAVSAAARDHLHLDRAAIVLVGDLDAFGTELEAAGLGTIVIDRDEVTTTGADEATSDAIGPIDASDLEGPTAGSEDPSLVGTSDEPVSADTSTDDGDANG